MKPQAKVTIAKHGGDDTLSWAVFINGKPVLTGLTLTEARYYRDQERKKRQTS